MSDDPIARIAEPEAQVVVNDAIVEHACDVCGEFSSQHNMGTGFATCRGFLAPIYRSTLNEALALCKTELEAKIVIDDAMVERACARLYDANWPRYSEDGFCRTQGVVSTKQHLRENMRGILTAALSGGA